MRLIQGLEEEEIMKVSWLFKATNYSSKNIDILCTEKGQYNLSTVSSLVLVLTCMQQMQTMSYPLPNNTTFNTVDYELSAIATNKEKEAKHIRNAENTKDRFI